jgi:phosphoadenosine phosphosulfate reductase
MYGYEWTKEYGIYRLSIYSKIEKEIRPVFKEELDFFGMDSYWAYPDTTMPILWAEGIRRYILNGECVAEAKGGGYYTKPVIEVYKPDLTLQEVDIDALWALNEQTMKGLEQQAITFIREKYDDFKKENYAFVVAFSGGKDSLVLLDLINKALSPDEFYVIFSNTGMELDCTLVSVRQAERHWSNLRFHWAESHLSPDKSWDEFGPPGRRMRWCCTVHKSVPTIIKLRELTGNYDVKAVVFDGVRAEESASRAQYEKISIGAKNVNQINCSPILNWNTAEIYLYLLKNNILFNNAYRFGLFRVGCKVCPMSSAWWDGIVNSIYQSEITPLLKKIEEYAAKTKPLREQKKFIEQGGWRARMGGRGLSNVAFACKKVIP